ncbi:MAG: LacI family DNA-binding transcriptional regulator [Actinomycetota bacterium]
MPVDIREVARRTGVSVATVSRALNGRPDVSAATRTRVTEMARTLGYLPNSQARALVRRRSDTVGLIWDTGYVSANGRVPFLQDLLIGLKMALADTGYHLMLLSPKTADRDLEAFVRATAQHTLDGVVLMGVDQHLPAVTALIDSGPPCVGLDLPVRGPRASYVSSDNQSAAATAVRHLQSLGHRKIATITGPPDQLPSIERLAGFRAGMAEFDLPVPAEYVVHGDFFHESGHSRMQDLLALPDRPTAVFVAGDLMAIGAMRAIAEAGLHVPQDISVLGFDDVESAALVRPGLSTMAQDYLAMGQAAVSLLTQMMGTSPVGSATIDRSEAVGIGRRPAPRLLPCSLVVRESTGVVPQR